MPEKDPPAVKSDLLLPTIIDVEASGFGRGSYPIEIGLAMTNGDTRCFLVRPADDWTHWDPAAEAVHGISRDTLLRHGHPPEEVAAALNELLRGQEVYSDAWGHDSSWIGKLFDAVGSHARFRILTLRSLLTDSQLTFWQQARHQLTRQRAQRHRASTDANLIQQTFVLSRQMAEQSFVDPLPDRGSDHI